MGGTASNARRETLPESLIASRKEGQLKYQASPLNAKNATAGATLNLFLDINEDKTLFQHHCNEELRYRAKTAFSPYTTFILFTESAAYIHQGCTLEIRTL
eukprot:1159967-Pelagomonas_calceolata.AAC.3